MQAHPRSNTWIKDFARELEWAWWEHDVSREALDYLASVRIKSISKDLFATFVVAGYAGVLEAGRTKKSIRQVVKRQWEVFQEFQDKFKKKGFPSTWGNIPNLETFTRIWCGVFFLWHDEKRVLWPGWDWADIGQEVEDTLARRRWPLRLGHFLGHHYSRIHGRTLQLTLGLEVPGSPRLTDLIRRVSRDSQIAMEWRRQGSGENQQLWQCVFARWLERFWRMCELEEDVRPNLKPVGHLISSESLKEDVLEYLRGYPHKQKRPQPLLDSMLELIPTRTEESFDLEQIDKIKSLIARLPSKDRFLIEASFARGESETTIAERLGISQSAVSQRRTRLLERLRKKIGESTL